MRKLTELDLANLIGSMVEGYFVECVRIKDGPFADSDHYGFIMGRNSRNEYVTYQFHLLNDGTVSVCWGHYMANREEAIQDFYTRDLDSSTMSNVDGP